MKTNQKATEILNTPFLALFIFFFFFLFFSQLTVGRNGLAFTVDWQSVLLSSVLLFFVVSVLTALLGAKLQIDFQEFALSTLVLILCIYITTLHIFQKEKKRLSQRQC